MILSKIETLGFLEDYGQDEQDLQDDRRDLFDNPIPLILSKFDTLGLTRELGQDEPSFAKASEGGRSVVSFFLTNIFIIGESPSGKAHGSGPCIRGFESLLPSHSASQASQNG